MVNFTKCEARAWARQNLKGVCNVVIPSYTSDLRGLNEEGVRHDIRKVIEYGFKSTLLVSEVAITPLEYLQFVRWSHEESGERLLLVYHAAFNTLNENIEVAKKAELAGADLALLTYPANFYPESLEDVYLYTKAFCDATNLAVMLFPVPLWGFERLHPADIPTDLLQRLLEDCPNIVAIKAEGGYPSIMSQIECHRLFSSEVIISCPIEGDMIPLAQLLPMQFSGTSNTEYFGGTIPHIFELLQRRQFDEATRLYWQIHPARKANGAINGPAVAASMFVNRMIWKYQAWLQGFNGGPMRQPIGKISEAAMNIARQGLSKAGLKPTESPNRDFFVGRHPA